MKKNKMVSIVVPVYNAERFLSLCLDSIVKQSYTEWELIAVDDGSTDGSLDILKAYEEREARIHVVSQKNEGVSIARNVAISLAKGDYIYFVDADDVVMPDALKILVGEIEAKKATFVKSDFLPIDEQGEQVFVNKKQVVRRKYNEQILCAEAFMQKVLMKEYFLWTCLFRSDIIVEYYVQFIPHCRLMEDSAFIVDYLLHSDRNVYKDACVYGYRKYENTTSVVKRDYSNDLEMIVEHLKMRQLTTIQRNLICEVKKTLILFQGSFLKKKLIKVYFFWERVVTALKYVYCKL